MKKKLFANNWQAFKDAPSSMYEACEYEEFMDWKVHGWELPSSHAAIIRYTTKTGKVKELVYKQPKAAERKINELMDQQLNFTVCDHEQIANLVPDKDHD